MVNQLPVEKLRNVCDVNFLHCESTKEFRLTKLSVKKELYEP